MTDNLKIEPYDKGIIICSCRRVNLLDLKTTILNHKDEDKEKILSTLKTSLDVGTKCGSCISPDHDPNNRKSDYVVNYLP